jgi:hypothetical protein
VFKENLVVRWLPVCHIPHGYRRVFLLSTNHQVQSVIVLSFMGYEDVYNIKQKVKTHDIQDPSLLWGLSVVNSLIGTEALSESEDGYLSIRPKPMHEEEPLPIDVFLKAAEDGEFYIESVNRKKMLEQN